MESKKQFDMYFDEAFDAFYDAIDVPSMSLLQAIDNVKTLKFILDPKLVQIVIQKKLDHHLADYCCPACKKQLHEKYIQLREVATTIGTLTFSFPYLRCPSCNTNHTPYEDALNLRKGKYQYDVQKLAARMASGVPPPMKY